MPATRVRTMVGLVLYLLLCLSSFKYAYRVTNSFRGREFITKLFESSANRSPTSIRSSIIDNAKKTYGLSLGALTFLLGAAKVRPVEAIGDMYEVKDQKFVLQDVSFKVNRVEADIRAMSAVFQNSLKTLRSFRSVESDGSKSNSTVIAFGPDTYTISPSYHPGVSSFFDGGGHATITLKSKLESSSKKALDSASAYEIGNGLQFVKIGTEVLRLSKGIANGATVSNAYGWVDLLSPSGIPFEIVVGVAKDPLMLVCLAVTDMTANVDFFTQTLGMMPLPFPHARSKGSQYEPAQPPEGKYFSYGEDSMGLLIVPISVVNRNAVEKENETVGANKKGSREKSSVQSEQFVSVGNVLDCFTIVYDDQVSAPSESGEGEKGKRVGDANTKKTEFTVSSPDGYRFRFVPYSTFAATASSSVQYKL